MTDPGVAPDGSDGRNGGEFDPDGPTLATLLGRSEEAPSIVVNGDDLGLCDAQNDATLHALANGHLTSATLMVPCPAAADAARRSVADGLPVGVHLTLTSEWPNLRWGPITADAALCDDDGFLPRTALGVYAKGPEVLDAVHGECVAQVEQALAWGIDVTHIDSHMAVNQLHPDFFEIYIDVAEQFDLPLRMGPAAMDASQGWEQRSAAAAKGLLFCDDLMLGAGDAAMWGRVVTNLRPGVTEIFVHAAAGTDEFLAFAGDAAAQRVTDFALVTDADSPFAPFDKVDYVEIRELQRNRRRHVA